MSASRALSPPGRNLIIVANLFAQRGERLCAQKLASVMKYALPIVASGLGTVSKELATEFKFNLDLTKQLATMLPDIAYDDQAKLMRDEASHVEGAELRWLRSFLDEKDKTHQWGGLNRVLTPEGHYLWLCDEHRGEYE